MSFSVIALPVVYSGGVFDETGCPKEYFYDRTRGGLYLYHFLAKSSEIHREQGVRASFANEIIKERDPISSINY